MTRLSNFHVWCLVSELFRGLTPLQYLARARLTVARSTIPTIGKQKVRTPFKGPV